MKNYKKGVNSNGIEWTLINGSYVCSYYLGEGDFIEAVIEDVEQDFIDELTVSKLTLISEEERKV